MAVIAADVLLKTAIEAALVDLRRNNWLLDDVFSGLATDPLAMNEYGYKEVQLAKEWFTSNQIEVYMNNRIDNPRFPCITIVQTSSREMQERASLADDGSIEEVEPKGRRKQVQKVYAPFTPKGYDPTKGFVILPDHLNTDALVAGMFLISARSGKAYVVTSVTDDTTFSINKNITDDFTGCYIVPANSLWNIHREQVFMEESFAVGLHAQSDVNKAIWMRQLMIYILLRYKEAYLEARGYELSSFNVGSIDINPYFKEAENVYSCPITLSGQTEVSFIKFMAPKLQQVRGGIRIIDGPATPEQYLECLRQGWSMEKDKKE